MSLKSFCVENNRTHILKEWDAEKNLPITPDTIAHTSTIPVWWKCEKGHSWCTQAGSRSKGATGCPKCREEKLEEKRNRRLEEARERYRKKAQTGTDPAQTEEPLNFSQDIPGQ